MKVLHLIKTSVGAKWALLQMRELVNMGIEVHVALPFNGDLINKYKEYGVQVHEISFDLKRFILTLRRLNFIVRKVSPDIIHSHFVITTLFMRIALRRNKTVRLFQVPGPLHLESFIFRNIEIASSQKNDFWAGSCQWTKHRYVKSGIDKSRVFLSYYGGDLHETTGSGRTLRKELKLSDSAIIVGMVAYMYAPKWYLGQTRGIKGHEDFIDAISFLQKKYPELYGVCIGGPWDGAIGYEQRVIKYAKKKKARVYFLGNRKNVFELYQDINIAVHPSHSENLGGAPESMYNMVPTVATNVGGFPDIVIDKTTGFLVKPHDPEGLAFVIEDIINNKYNIEDICKNAKSLTLELMDVKKTAKTIAGIYKSISISISD